MRYPTYRATGYIYPRDEYLDTYFINPYFIHKSILFLKIVNCIDAFIAVETTEFIEIG